MESGSASPASELTAPSVDASLESKIALYEQKIEQLSNLLNDEEESHRELQGKLEAKIDELQQAVSATESSRTSSPPSETVSPVVTAAVVPVNKSKVKVLEQRIVEMTIVLEDKDKRIFELESELDRVKVELNQMRVEVARIPELEATMLDLDNQIAALKPKLPEDDSVRLDDLHEGVLGPPSDDGQPELIEAADAVPEEPMVAERPSEQEDSIEKVSALEKTIMELSDLVAELRADKEVLLTERDQLVTVVLEEARIEELKKRVAELEEQLEISEMNRRILRDNFTKENEVKLELQVELERMKARELVIEAPSPVRESENEPEPEISDESTEKIIKAQQLQIETLTMELNTLRALPKITDGSAEGTQIADQFMVRQSPRGGCQGCFSGLFSRRR